MDTIKNSEKGAGLVEVLIAVGISLVLLVFSLKTMTEYNKFDKHKKIQVSQLLLKNHINKLVDCKKTAEELSNTCNLDQYIKVKSLANKTLINVPKNGKPTKIGRYQVRAKCSSCPECPQDRKIEIEARLVSKKNKPVKHPIYKKARWIPLYDKTPFHCFLYSG